MANVILRPDLRTAGGEVNDVVLDGRYAGTLTLVYREGDRISGSIQLEEESLSYEDKDDVMEYVQQYVQSMIDALGVVECDVLVTYSKYEHVIATDRNIGQISDFVEEDWASLDYGEEIEFVDVDPYGEDELEMFDDDEDEGSYFELVIVDESRNRVEYHIYDEGQELLAEVFMSLYGTDVVGYVQWMDEPNDDEIHAVADLIVSDFDEDEIDTFVIDMKFGGEIMETIELTHEDLLNEFDTNSDEFDMLEEFDEEDYTIVMVRDDQDTLTYEIYQQSNGGLPIGTATVDVSSHQITGFIDFREPGNDDDREYIATLLMRELDKEKDYDSFNLTMMYNNKPIDELRFELDQVH